MKYRKANLQDTKELARLRWFFQCNNEKYDNSFIRRCNNFIRHGIQSKSWTIWIAEDKNKIISHIYIYKVNKLPKPKAKFKYYGYITNVYTKKEYRNKGIGTMLMRKVKKWAKHEKFEFLVAWRSKDSKTYYEKNGFKTNDEIMEKSYE